MAAALTFSASRKRLAQELSLRRARPDPIRDWFEAEEQLTRERAFYLSRRNGRSPDPWLDWIRAKAFVDWRTWAEAELADCHVAGVSRPYLAVAACRQRDVLAARLSQACPLDGQLHTAGFVAVLDGAPEYAHSRCVWDNDECVSDVEHKDNTFFAFCRDTLALHKTSVVEGGRPESCGAVRGEERTFEDGCIGAFGGKAAVCDAVSAALHLRSFLLSFNYEHELSWQEQYHVRIAIACSWEMALRELLNAHRDDVVVEDQLFARLEPCTKRTLLAGGVRLGTSRVAWT